MLPSCPNITKCRCWCYYMMMVCHSASSICRMMTFASLNIRALASSMLYDWL